MSEHIKNISRICMRNLLPIIVAVSIGLIAVSPHIRAWYSVGPEHFLGVYPTFSDDEVYYQARIKEAQEGDFAISNPYLKEHGNDPFIVPPLPEWVYAGIAIITGWSVPLVTAVADFVLTTIAFLCVYALMLGAAGKRQWIALGYALAFFIFFLTTFGRPVSPQFNVIFFVLGLFWIQRIFFAERGVSSRAHALLGLGIGLTSFISPYYFSALTVLYGLAMLVRAVLDKVYTPFIRQTRWFLACFLPPALLFVYFQYSAGQVPFYIESTERFGLMHTHIPGAFKNIALALSTLGVVLSAFTLLPRGVAGFSCVLMCSLVVLNWQNVITGKSLQFSSHYLLTGILFVLLVFASLHSHIFSNAQWRTRPVRMIPVALGMLCVMGAIAYHQRSEYRGANDMPYTQEELTALQAKQEVFTWLRMHTPQNSVVYTLGGNYDFLLPIYTENKVFYNFYATLFVLSNVEAEDRWLRQHWFDSEMSTTTLYERQRDFWGNRFIDTYQSIENRKKILAKLRREAYVPGEMVDAVEIERMYAQWVRVKSERFAEMLSGYTIDYILVGKDYPEREEALRVLNASPDVVLRTVINDEYIFEYIGNSTS